MSCGTGNSNPVPSSAESANHRYREFPRDHRRKTEPSNCMPSVPDSAGCAIPKRSHAHRQLSTALSSGCSKSARGYRRRTPCGAHRLWRGETAVTGRSGQLGLSGRGMVRWTRLCRCLRCSTPTALSTPQLRRPDLSIPGLARRFPRNARPAGTSRTERSQRFGRGEGQLQQVYLSAQVNVDSMKVHSLYRT